MDEIGNAAIAHMTMIQGVVARLETNSFTLKVLAMTVAAAVLAFTGSVAHPSWTYPLAGCVPVILFWVMDAKYLRLGRLYRRLYDSVRKGMLSDHFSMDTQPFDKDEKSVARIVFSWSVSWFYSAILAALVIVSAIHFRSVEREFAYVSQVFLQFSL